MAKLVWEIVNISPSSCNFGVIFNWSCKEDEDSEWSNSAFALDYSYLSYVPTGICIMYVSKNNSVICLDGYSSRVASSKHKSHLCRSRKSKEIELCNVDHLITRFFIV